MSECPICLDDLVNDDKASYQLKCNHQFHFECISRWLNQKDTCPLCRDKVELDPRYVDDGIMNQERYLELVDKCKSMIKLGSTALEKVFPKLEGFSDTLMSQEGLDQDVANFLSREVDDNAHIKLLGRVVAVGLYQFVFNSVKDEKNQQENIEEQDETFVNNSLKTENEILNKWVEEQDKTSILLEIKHLESLGFHPYSDINYPIEELILIYQQQIYERDSLLASR